ncbi:MAG: CDP-glucose 4,6-dehydratase [Bacteroidales bacterium]|nr:CDP-glucose 4,6-dehydratase [Bacteroidales bacterium]
MLSNLFRVYKDKKVLVTGNTGFKGSWISQWLLQLSADVSGLALDSPTQPALFHQLALEREIRYYKQDIRDFHKVKRFLREVKPDIIFHLAAQSLVRESYITPLETLETNVLGTANLLEAIRQLRLSTVIIIITSDKSYENQEWLFGYRENDPVGGYDPYSASKGAAEIVTSSWRRSFFNPQSYPEHGVKVATVRAGNVIGGGDWSKDRILPDCIRYLQRNETIEVRNPFATRPWQHVLEPLGGYLLLGNKLLTCEEKEISTYCSAFNFGPLISSNKSVQSLVEEVIKCWGSGNWDYNKQDKMHEASMLNLTIDKAYHVLQWHPLWNFKETVEKTVAWYKNTFDNITDPKEITLDQISFYQNKFKIPNTIN